MLAFNFLTQSPVKNILGCWPDLSLILSAKLIQILKLAAKITMRLVPCILSN